jgi:hypothetical protein
MKKRRFNVSVSEARVACAEDQFHVPPRYHEEFVVTLSNKYAKDYDLHVELQGEAKKMLEIDQLNERTIILKDDCDIRGKAKFSIELTPKSTADPVTPLDPIIVND